MINWIIISSQDNRLGPFRTRKRRGRTRKRRGQGNLPTGTFSGNMPCIYIPCNTYTRTRLIHSVICIWQTLFCLQRGSRQISAEALRDRLISQFYLYRSFLLVSRIDGRMFIIYTYISRSEQTASCSTSSATRLAHENVRTYSNPILKIKGHQ